MMQSQEFPNLPNTILYDMTCDQSLQQIASYRLVNKQFNDMFTDVLILHLLDTTVPKAIHFIPLNVHWNSDRMVIQTKGNYLLGYSMNASSLGLSKTHDHKIAPLPIPRGKNVIMQDDVLTIIDAGDKGHRIKGDWIFPDQKTFMMPVYNHATFQQSNIAIKNIFLTAEKTLYMSPDRSLLTYTEQRPVMVLDPASKTATIHKDDSLLVVYGNNDRNSEYLKVVSKAVKRAIAVEGLWGRTECLVQYSDPSAPLEMIHGFERRTLPTPLDHVADKKIIKGLSSRLDDAYVVSKNAIVHLCSKNDELSLMTSPMINNVTALTYLDDKRSVFLVLNKLGHLLKVSASNTDVLCKDVKQIARVSDSGLSTHWHEIAIVTNNGDLTRLNGKNSTIESTPRSTNVDCIIDRLFVRFKDGQLKNFNDVIGHAAAGERDSDDIAFKKAATDRFLHYCDQVNKVVNSFTLFSKPGQSELKTDEQTSETLKMLLDKRGR